MKLYEVELLRAGVLSDGLGTFTDGVLSQLTGQKQANGCLDLATSDSRALVVMRQTGSLGSDALKDIINKTVHDTHRLRRDTGVRMYLLEHLIDVDCVRFLTLAFLLLIGLCNVFLSLTGFLGCFSTCFRRHDESTK